MTVCSRAWHGRGADSYVPRPRDPRRREHGGARDTTSNDALGRPKLHCSARNTRERDRDAIDPHARASRADSHGATAGGGSGRSTTNRTQKRGTNVLGAHAALSAYAHPMPTKLSLEQHAAEVRKSLNIPRQSDVFKAAVEAGYLTALADGTVDEQERAVLVRAVELLSEGVVLEWETSSLLDECAASTATEGADMRAKAVGARLKELDQAIPGLLVAAFVARAADGIAKSESEVLKAIGKAAGLTPDQVKSVVKRATNLEGT